MYPFQRALYGHPESGAIWEQHLSSILEELGWERVAAHPGTWAHKETKALLAVYVDDLLMTAPPSHEKELWKALEARVNFDQEPSELAAFLGAHHHLSKSGNMTTGKVQMREFLLDAVATRRRRARSRSLRHGRRTSPRISVPRVGRKQVLPRNPAVRTSWNSCLPHVSLGSILSLQSRDLLAK